MAGKQHVAVVVFEVVDVIEEVAQGGFVEGVFGKMAEVVGFEAFCDEVGRALGALGAAADEEVRDGVLFYQPGAQVKGIFDAGGGQVAGFIVLPRFFCCRLAVANQVGQVECR